MLTNATKIYALMKFPPCEDGEYNFHYGPHFSMTLFPTSALAEDAVKRYLGTKEKDYVSYKGEEEREIIKESWYPIDKTQGTINRNLDDWYMILELPLHATLSGDLFPWEIGL